MSAHPAATLAHRFALGVAGLRDMLTAHLIRTNVAQPGLIFLCLRLHALRRRIANLAGRLAEGRLPSPPPRAEPAARPTSPNAPTQLHRQRRTAPGWLFDLDIRFATYTEYFRDLLAQPEMAALLEAAPHLRRQLRSVLRPLMAELPPILALPPRPPRAKPANPPTPSRTPRPPRRARTEPDRLPDIWRPGPIRPPWTA